MKNLRVLKVSCKTFVIVHLFKIKCWQIQKQKQVIKRKRLKICSCPSWNNRKIHETSGADEFDAEREELSEDTLIDSKSNFSDHGAGLEKEDTDIVEIEIA